MMMIAFLVLMVFSQVTDAQNDEKTVISFGLKFYVDDSVVNFLREFTLKGKSMDVIRRFIKAFYCSTVLTINKIFANILKNYKFVFTVDEFSYLNSTFSKYPSVQITENFEAFLKNETIVNPSLIHVLLVKSINTKTRNSAIIGRANPHVCTEIMHKKSMYLEAAFDESIIHTMTHELAHLLGVNHDTNVRDCNQTPKIMSKVSNDRHIDRFSNCSRLTLARKILYNEYSCSRNRSREMTTQEKQFTSYYLGSVLDIRKQCSHIFHQQDGKVDFLNIVTENCSANCTAIQRLPEYKFNNTVIYINLFDGTKCDKNKMCFDLKCIQVPKEYAKIYNRSIERNFNSWLSLKKQKLIV